MAVLYDARGNEIRGGFPDVVNGETYTDGRTATTNLSAVNAEVVVDLNGSAAVNVDLRSASLNGTVVFEGTVDGTNYWQVPAFATSQTINTTVTSDQFVPSVAVSTTTLVGQYILTATGFRRIRVRLSAWVSGTLAVAMRGTGANFLINSAPIPSTLAVTATAAANTAVTATLPAAGVGLFHYITSIQIVRNATAALAGTATLIHTTTNLPGSLAWSVGNAMAAGGTQVDVALSPTTPLKSSVANTATTVVAAAAGAAVLSRVNVTYYVGQ